MSEVIKVSIGSEPMQLIPSLVLVSSILRRTKRKVEFSMSWNSDAGWQPLMNKTKSMIQNEKVFGGTNFNLWRWLVPKHYKREGKAIYLDADQVVLADIGELWDILKPEYDFAAVCGAEGHFGGKTIEENSCETSVMVMDCKKCDWDMKSLIAQVDDGTIQNKRGGSSKSPYGILMQAKWYEKPIQELPPEWNHFNICTEKTKLVHWSHVRSQPYRNPGHETANIFRTELKKANIASEVLEKEVNDGNLHETYLN